jgi:hypothetical protein
MAPDGKRMLMLFPLDTKSETPQINIVLNWFTELQQRVAVKESEGRLTDDTLTNSVNFRVSSGR